MLPPKSKDKRGNYRVAKRRGCVLGSAEMKNLLLAMGSLVVGTHIVLANGSAWQTGVPGTGSASASNKSQKTDVTSESETLKINLQPEYAEVEGRYRMHNTCPKRQ